MKKIVLASNNKGKIKEFRELFPAEYEIVTMSEAGFTEDVEETGTTFYENALLKAKTVSESLGVAVISDDSGLMVEALGGAPGVYSARYAGSHGNDSDNKRLLLKNMEGAKNRRAKFHSTVLFYDTDGTIIVGEGETHGEIMLEEVGTNGFGYDPLFFSYDLQKSFGVATSEEKNSVSHRNRAIRDLLGKL